MILHDIGSEQVAMIQLPQDRDPVNTTGKTRGVNGKENFDDAALGFGVV
jgi:hypothetical protein